jgi:hypothetical protein
VRNFDDASRLIPLRDSDSATSATSIRWIDPESLRAVRTQGGLGQGWFDYLDGVRETYADCRDDIARGVKKFADVPVVFKRVTPWVSGEVINRSPGGFDGVGLELYPAEYSPVNQGLAAGRVEADLASQTTWLLGTELGYSSSSNNKGRRGFPDAAYIDTFVQTCAAFGAKGFMFFGLRLEPYSTWKAMQLHAQPDQLAWIVAARKHLNEQWPALWPVAQAFPEGQNWWWKSNNVSLTRYNAVLDGPPSWVKQSILLAPADGSASALWAVSSTPVVPHAVTRVVNFATVESAERYGPQVAKWIAQGEKVIYLGTLPDGAHVAGLDEHFTAERIKIGEEGNDGRVLTVNPGDKVLAEQDGKPWAKRAGNLLIIADWPVEIKPNAVAPLSTVDPKWVRDFLSADKTNQ